MKQIIQNPRTGSLELLEVPIPALAPGQVLVRNHYSVVSPGTERMAMDFARQSLLGKARGRPDLVKQVLRKVRQEGPLPTYRSVVNRLDAPQTLGYASAGVVEAVGPGVTSLVRGDRVACAGAGYASHAEFVCVPENLVVAVPRDVALDQAAFSTLGAIAMQGLRVIEPQLGEVCVVIGLGLIGQLALQLLLANGCRVLAIDLDATRVKRALELGAEWGGAPDEDFEGWKTSATAGHGADFVLVTAASNSSAPIQLAADLSRHKGRVGIVGATAMDLDRRSFYEKELELRMSMSYGPGRYDRTYEESGLDYPYAYVRWTEKRNLESFLALVARGGVDPLELGPSRVAFDESVAAYDELASGGQRALAFLFEYDVAAEAGPRHVEMQPARSPKSREEVGIALLGAGNYAKAVLLPALESAPKIRKDWIVTSTGPSAQRTADRFSFQRAGTDPEEALRDSDVDLVFVATRHDSHADLARKALEAGKSVWLEKPVALDREQLAGLLQSARESAGFLTVGYNRRFSAHARFAREALAGRRAPAALGYVIHAGASPSGTWIMDPRVGGGRLVGEVCHFVDLAMFVIGEKPTSVSARALGKDPEVDDSVVLSLGFDDGSIATIQYLANASTELPKERWEVSAEGRTVSCNNFRLTRLAGGRKCKTLNQDKGQAAAIQETVRRVRAAEPSPIPLDEIASTSLVCMTALESVGSGESLAVESLEAFLRNMETVSRKAD